jgi:hypothetical protein
MYIEKDKMFQTKEDINPSAKDKRNIVYSIRQFSEKVIKLSLCGL